MKNLLYSFVVNFKIIHTISSLCTISLKNKYKDNIILTVVLFFQPSLFLSVSLNPTLLIAICVPYSIFEIVTFSVKKVSNGLDSSKGVETSEGKKEEGGTFRGYPLSFDFFSNKRKNDFVAE